MQTPEQNQNGITNETEKKLLQEKCKDIGIYGLKNKINGKWYIGQTHNPICDRFNAYRNMRCKSQAKLYRALNKYGYAAFDKVVLEICKSDKNILNEKEVYWIVYYDSIKNGYNIRSGGKSGNLSSDTKKKMSKSHTGKKFSIEHKTNLSKSAKLRPKQYHTKETIEKMKLQKKGTNRGPKNGNFGKFWITNGTDNKMTFDKTIPTGWKLGRSHQKL